MGYATCEYCGDKAEVYKDNNKGHIVCDCGYTIPIRIKPSIYSNQVGSLFDEEDINYLCDIFKINCKIK